MATCAGCVPPGTGCALEASPLLCPPLPEMFLGGSLSRLWGALCSPCRTQRKSHPPAYLWVKHKIFGAWGHQPCCAPCLGAPGVLPALVG